MRLKRLFSAVFLTVAMFSVSEVQAAPIFVGQWQVDDGLNWTTNPPVYSGQEAAAFLFGGLPSDYSISTLGPDPTTINHLAWYSTWGVVGGQALSESLHHDLGNPGYNDPGGTGTASSAFVDDNAMGAQFTNYAFREDDLAAIPEPASLSLMGIGLAFVARRARNRYRKH